MIKDRVKIIFAQQVGVAVESMHDNMSLVDDLNFDSLDLIEIIMELEQTFSIVIDDTEYNDSFTLQQTVNLIEQKLA